jgi:hypothetical protein
VRIGDGDLVVICWLCVEAAVDLFASRAVQIPDLEAKASRLDQGFGKGGNADVVGFALGGFNVVCTICLDIPHGNKVPEVVCVRLHPGTSKKLGGLGGAGTERGGNASDLDVGDDGHGFIHVIEGPEQDVGRGTVHGLHRVGELAHQFKGVIGKVDPDVARVANVVEQVTHGVEACFFIAKLVGVADTQQCLEVGEGDSWSHGLVRVVMHTASASASAGR